MKAKDIKEYEIGEHCFGDILRVNGVDYEDLKEWEAVEFIIDMMKNDINKGNIVKELFETCLESLQAELVESSNHTCDQCGNYNTYGRFVV